MDESLRFTELDFSQILDILEPVRLDSGFFCGLWRGGQGKGLCLDLIICFYFNQSKVQKELKNEDQHHNSFYHPDTYYTEN